MWVSILARFRDAEPAVLPTPPDVRAWDMLGCLRVDVDAWDAPADSARPAFPPLWLLLADDFDPWGRTYDTYRAIPFSRDSVVTGATPYRWFTRADTVWLVWSENDARGGLALRRSGRDWTGRIGIRDPGADAQSNGIASAWQVNCWSLDRRRTGPARR